MDLDGESAAAATIVYKCVKNLVVSTLLINQIN